MDESRKERSELYVVGPLARDIILRGEIVSTEIQNAEEFFNPFHDPENGRFTTGPSGGGNKSLESGLLIVRRRFPSQKIGLGGRNAFNAKTEEQGVSIKGDKVLVAKGSGLLKKPSPELTSLVDGLKDDVDGVHRTSDIPVVVSHKKIEGVRARYLPGNKNILVNPSYAPEIQKASLKHEYGHHMDHMMGWASYRDEKLQKAWVKSKAFKEIQNNVALPAGFKAYALTAHELWGRSYAQWLANKSKDKTSIAIHKEFAKRNGYQWTDSDFAPISKEMDRIFNSYGLLK